MKSFFLLLFVLVISSSSAFNWDSFLNLTSCHHGDTNSALLDLKNYLNHFGYLAPSNFSDHFDDDLETALRTYQQNFNLDVTGLLDLPTITQLISPRCGVADIINGTSTMASGKLSSGRHLYAYFPGNPTWPFSKRQLTYALTSTSAVPVDPSVLSAVFALAFSRWSAATNLNFTEVGAEAEPDISIGFYRGDHGDGEPFDGVLGTLAHAFSPTDGRFHLDAAESWVAQGDVTEASSANAVDLESVAVHEIGHLLGLGHSSVGEAIMYPTIRTRTKKVELAKDDVVGVQSLYGSNPNYVGGGSAGATKQERDMNNGSSARKRRAAGWGGTVGILVLAGVVFGL